MSLSFYDEENVQKHVVHSNYIANIILNFKTDVRKKIVEIKITLIEK